MRAALPLLAPFALLAVGCAPRAQQVGGTLRRGAPPRVVSLSPSTTEIMLTNMDARTLVGRTAADDFPQSAARVTIVAGVKPDFEKIKSVTPGLVLYDADLYNPDDVKRIEAMGVESYAFKSHTLSGFEKEIYTLAGKIGSETNVSEYVDRIERERSEAEGDPPTPTPKVAVVLGNGDYVAGTDSFLADVIKIVGAKPVGPASDKFAAMSPEAAVAAAPDVIVLATTKATAAKDSAALAANPRFATSPAVKNGRVSAVEQDIVLRRGCRVDVLVRDLHRAVAIRKVE